MALSHTNLSVAHSWISPALSDLFQSSNHETQEYGAHGPRILAFSQLTRKELYQEIHFWRINFKCFQDRKTDEVQERAKRLSEACRANESANGKDPESLRDSSRERDRCDERNHHFEHRIENWYQCKETGVVHNCQHDYCRYQYEDYKHKNSICQATAIDFGILTYHQWQVEKEEQDKPSVHEFKELVNPLQFYEPLHPMLKKDINIPDYMKKSINASPQVKRKTPEDGHEYVEHGQIKRRKLKKEIIPKHSHYQQQNVWVDIFRSNLELYFKFSQSGDSVTTLELDQLTELCYKTFELITSTEGFKQATNKTNYQIWYHTLVVLNKASMGGYSTIIPSLPYLKNKLIPWNALKKFGCTYSIAGEKKKSNKRKLFQYKQQHFNLTDKLFHQWLGGGQREGQDPVVV